MRTLSYGPNPSQVVDLYLADSASLLHVLLHGGFWRVPYGRDEFDRIIPSMQRQGHSIANVEYRRVGEEGGGWPATGADILAAIDLLQREIAVGRPTLLIGFSAGGHLALWAARERGTIAGVAGLAPISDLHDGAVLGLGRGAVRDLLGGLPKGVSERFAQANPIERPRIGVPEVLIHGVEDDTVPVQMSRRNAAQAGAVLVEVAGEGQLNHLDPGSRCHQALLDRRDRWGGVR
jgi:acetyl esterase/lipase